MTTGVGRSGVDSRGRRTDLHGEVVSQGDLGIAVAKRAGDAETVG